MPITLNGFLADTWWYAMTSRLSDADFFQLIQLRVMQGFDAAQVVIGIPPETTPDNPNAASPVGPAWTWSGEFNEHYLQFSRNRILRMNQTGLAAIVYGAWGQQICWLGVDRMTEWWKRILDYTSDLNVIYCLTGESNHHLGLGDIGTRPLKWSRAYKLGEKLRTRFWFRRITHRLFQKPFTLYNRRRAWSQVLDQLVRLTRIPIIIHPCAGEAGFECVNNPSALAVNTIQTGHSYRSRKLLYQLPLALANPNSPDGRGFINLEPWYEGILDQFQTQDQLYAYWVSILAGAVSYCYGAQGIWNAGDGMFLDHWGTQTLQQAMALDTPNLLGLSHELVKPFLNEPGKLNLSEIDGVLVSIQRDFARASFTYVPEITSVATAPAGKYWLPLEGCFSTNLPAQGQVVIIH